LRTDFEAIQETGDPHCNILGEDLCRVVTSDPYTLVLVIWATLQLTWVTMLMFVQFVQISRALTTYENMRGSHHSHGKASEAITSALTTGAASWSGAQVGSTGMGPDPALPPTHAPGHHHHHKAGCFAQWKKVLGIDTFTETALEGFGGNKSRPRQARNPFSHGCLGNCKDFWCDPAPIFGKRENGSALLGGQAVDYTSMYESPRLATRRRGDGDVYEAVASEETV
jgi:palmitoyltransferase